MKLNAEVDGEEVALEVRREGERVFADVGGRRYELEARELGGGEYLLLHDGRVYECRVEQAQGRGSLVVSVGAEEYAVTLTDPKHLRGARVAGGHDAGRAQVVAPMPGKVVRVLVERGQAVEAGAGLRGGGGVEKQEGVEAPEAGPGGGTPGGGGGDAQAGGTVPGDRMGGEVR